MPIFVFCIGWYKKSNKQDKALIFIFFVIKLERNN